MIVIVLSNINLSSTTITTLFNLLSVDPLASHDAFLDHPLLLDLLLHLHEPLEFEPLPDLFLAPPLFLLGPSLLGPSPLQLRHLLVLPRPVQLIFLALPVPDTLALLVRSLPLRGVLLTELLVLGGVIG